MARILKAAPGLDQDNLVARELGPGHEVIEYDPARSLVEQGEDVDVFLLRDVPVPAEVIDALPRLKLLQRVGHHLVGVDILHARAKGVRVANIPAWVSGGDRMVAEHALHLMFAVAKRARECQGSIRSRKLGMPTTSALTGKTLGLIGVGNTGTELAKLVFGLEMNVIAVKRTVDNQLKEQLGLAYMGDMSGLPKVLAEADFISLHLPLAPDTIQLFDKRKFAAMRSGSFLINVARAQIVEKSALQWALADGPLAGAGLDVFWDEPANPDDPLLQFDNVIVTPHVAGVTREVYARIASVTAENIRLVLDGKEPKYPVAPGPH